MGESQNMGGLPMHGARSYDGIATEQTVQPSRFQENCPPSPTGLCRDAVCPALQDALSDCPTILEQRAY